MKCFGHRFGRALAGAALLLSGLGQLAPASAAAAWKANADDALLFDVRLGQYRLGAGVRGYATPSGPCVDLADTIIALDIPIRLDKKLRRATGWAFAERRTITIDREADTVQIMNNSAKLGADEIIDAPEGWCVNVKALSGWLGVGLEADQANALLMIRSDTKLPVELQMERRARASKVQSFANFDLRSLPQAKAPFGKARLPAVDAVISVGGLRQGRAANGRDQFNFGYELYAAGEVGPIAYNARLASDRKGAPESLRVQAYRVDPEARLLGPLKATHVAAGDVSGYSTALVSQSAVGRGAFVTNRPIERREAFDRTDFRGELPSGWDAELYRNGQLLAFAGAAVNGRYEFLDVPLLYGQNRFEIVLYGPQGQVRRELKNVPVGLESIPPRQTYYWAGFVDEGRDLIGMGGQARFGRTGLRGTFGVERGLNAKTSVAALGHSLVLEGGKRRSYAEMAARRAVGPTLVELSAAQAVEGGGGALRFQMLGEFGKTYVSAESIKGFGGFESDRVLRDVTGIHSLSVDHSFVFGRTWLPVHLDGRYTTRVGGVATLDASARVSTAIGRMSLTGQLDWRDQRRRFGPDPEDMIDASLLANARIGRVRVRGEARYRLSPDPRFESLALVGEWSGKGGDERHRNDWRAEIGYDRSLRRGRVGLGYVRRFEKFALTASIEGATDGSVAGGLNLAFSVGPDPRRQGGIRVTSERQATQGQVVATVFRDSNGNGRRDAGEPLEKDVQLSAGRAPVERLTGPDGQVIIDSLEPFQPVLIGVDASSLPDPLVQPSTQGLVVTPRPGMAVAIELPLAAAGEVDGTLVKAGGGKLEGVDLELVDVEGRVAGRARSEYDGFFLFEGVPYGRYSLRIAKLAAEVTRLTPVLSGGIVVSGEAPAVHMSVVAARPSEMQAKAQAP
jgi:hypothetical protein